jgi:polyisoprenoid-binding protein YceI
MKLQHRFLTFLILVAPILSFAQGTGVAVHVTLSPAGSFIAETERVTGTAYKTADGVAAENVIVDINSLKTGVSLRDKHTKEHLLAEKFPQARLIKAIGKGGKGEAIVEIKGIKKKVAGTYTIAGNILKASFPLHLSDLDIKGIKYMGVGVKDDVTVDINLPLGPAPARTAKK